MPQYREKMIEKSDKMLLWFVCVFLSDSLKLCSHCQPSLTLALMILTPILGASGTIQINVLFPRVNVNINRLLFKTRNTMR